MPPSGACKSAGLLGAVIVRNIIRESGILYWMTLTGKSLGEAATFWFTREPLHSIAHVQETIIEFKHFSPFKEKLTVFIFPDHDIESLSFF